ncbi:hypothetical protein [Paludibaculum fermentans]|uniref:hypothetical protein n=1 Tax=Paludibaculum fermentans TaxID=1473598 RepID=UPI003EBE3ECC
MKRRNGSDQARVNAVGALGPAAPAGTTQPISERRLAANRANAQKSTGPRTPEGKLRVAQNAARHNLYSKLHHLPEEIADLLYRQALEETASIAEPRFRALLIHRFMLRGHERRLFQLEGKLWAEALRVNHGVVPDASLWIRHNHGVIVQALGRYHAWICVRIRQVQKSVFPYLIGDEAHQAFIPARVQTMLASAAGSARPITVSVQAAPPCESERASSTAGSPQATHPNPGLQLLLRGRGFRAVRPVPAPQAVKAIRPPTVPGLSLRFLNKTRKPTNGTVTPNGAVSVSERIANRIAPITKSEKPASPQSTPHEASNPTHPEPFTTTTNPNRRSTTPQPEQVHNPRNPAPHANPQSTPYEGTKPIPLAPARRPP